MREARKEMKGNMKEIRTGLTDEAAELGRSTADQLRRATERAKEKLKGEDRQQSAMSTASPYADAPRKGTTSSSQK